MKLVISDDQGVPIGELYTDAGHQWRDLLMYASERWEEASRADSGCALELILLEQAGA